jgi:hypothetical protein
VALLTRVGLMNPRGLPVTGFVSHCVTLGTIEFPICIGGFAAHSHVININPLCSDSLISFSVSGSQYEWFLRGVNSS